MSMVFGTHADGLECVCGAYFKPAIIKAHLEWGWSECERPQSAAPLIYKPNGSGLPGN